MNIESSGIINILIDYDNVKNDEYFDINSYVVSLLERIVRTISQDINYRVYIRLYGGWFEQSRLTRDAQILSTEIFGLSPKLYTYAVYNTRFMISKFEISRTLLINEEKELHHTYRSKKRINGLRLYGSKEYCCEEFSVFFRKLKKFKKNTGKCPYCNNEALSNIKFIEQKMVDTMLVSDLFYLSQDNNYILLVSDDDDFIPALFQASYYNDKIFNIRNKYNVNHNFQKFFGSSLKVVMMEDDDE